MFDLKYFTLEIYNFAVTLRDKQNVHGYDFVTLSLYMTSKMFMVMTLINVNRCSL